MPDQKRVLRVLRQGDLDAIVAIDALATLRAEWAVSMVPGETFRNSMIRHVPGIETPSQGSGVLRYLEALGFIKRERRPIGTDLVWMTEEGHGVIDDLVNEGSFDEHIAAVRHNL